MVLALCLIAALRRYVVKVIDSMRSPTLKVQEIRIMLHMEHRNVVKMVDFYSSGSNLCIVMEYCQGGDLSTQMREHRMEKKYVAQVPHCYFVTLYADTSRRIRFSSG